MGKPPNNKISAVASNQQPPTDFPTVPPATSHNPLVMEIGALKSSVERLIKDVGDISEKLSKARTSIDRFKTIIITVGACLGVFIPLFFGLFWWAVGEKINNLFKPPSIEAPAVPEKTEPPKK